MAELEPVVVTAINRRHGFALREDGILGRIRNYVDGSGLDCERDDPDAVAIIEWDDGGWTPVAVQDFTRAYAQ